MEEKNEQELYESLKDTTDENEWIGTVKIVGRGKKCVWKNPGDEYVSVVIGYGVNIYANRQLRKIEKVYFRLACWDEKVMNDLEKCHREDRIRVRGILRDLSKIVSYEQQEYSKEITIEGIEIIEMAGLQKAGLMTEGEMKNLWTGLLTEEVKTIVEKGISAMNSKRSVARK
jgi:hypothetical protein